MGDVISRARQKIGTVSSASLFSPSRSPFKTVRHTAAHATKCISSILNPSPISHVPGEILNSGVSGRFLQSKMFVDATVSQAIDWNIHRLRQSLHVAKGLVDKLGKLDKLVYSMKDRILSVVMEFKAGSNIPEPIERLFS